MSESPNCSFVYDIRASGCGNCPLQSSSTTTVCTKDIQIGSMQTCTFGVQTSCGDIVGDLSDLFTTVIPGYLFITMFVGDNYLLWLRIYYF